MNIKKSVFLIVAILIMASTCWAEDLYVSQSGAGDGSSCDSPKSVAWFNTSSNWGAGVGKISAGDTVYLCGTITTSLTFQGSGTSGNYITLDGTSATLSNIGIITGDSSNSRDYLTIQNLSWASGCNTTLLYIWGSWYIIVDNIYADNITARGIMITVDNAPRGSGTNKPHNITIKNSFIRTTAGSVGGTEVDMFATSGSYNVLLEGNKFVFRATGTNHNDIFQTWAGGHLAANRPSNYTLRFNWLEIDTTDSNDHSFFMVQELEGTNHVYGNVIYFKASGGGVNPHQWGSNLNNSYYNNNTLVYKAGATCIGIDDGPIMNNIAYGSGSNTWIDSNRNPSKPVLSYNLWYNGVHAWWVDPIGSRTGDTQGSDPLFIDYNSGDFSLQPTSPAIGTGTNLGTGPTGEWIEHKYDYGIAPGATWPNPTLVRRTGKWDRGAYQEGSIASPINFRIVNSN